MERMWSMFLTRSEALQLSGLSRRRMESLVNLGRVRTFKTLSHGRRWRRFHRDDIISYLNEQQQR